MEELERLRQLSIDSANHPMARITGSGTRWRPLPQSIPAHHAEVVAARVGSQSSDPHHRPGQPFVKAADNADLEEKLDSVATPKAEAPDAVLKDRGSPPHPAHPILGASRPDSHTQRLYDPASIKPAEGAGSWPRDSSSLTRKPQSKTPLSRKVTPIPPPRVPYSPAAIASAPAKPAMTKLRKVSSTQNELSPASPTSATSSYPIVDRSKFQLAATEMGNDLIPNIMKYLEDDSFSGFVSIYGLNQVDWAELACSIQPPKDHDLYAVRYSASRGTRGFSQLELSNSKKFEFPDFSKPVPKPTAAEIEECLRQVTETPPKGSIPYYVGPLTAPPPFDSILDPGPVLMDIDSIPGVNSLYCHAGEKFSGTAFHKEDAGFWSYNLTLYGYKLWIKIHTADTEKFEEFVRTTWKSGTCDQFVRHCSLLVGPEMLQAAGVRFDVQVAGPGDLVITTPRQYHAVVNVTRCFALAVNALPAGEQAIPGHLVVCPSCGLYPLQLDAFESVAAPPRDVGMEIYPVPQKKATPKSTSKNRSTPVTEKRKGSAKRQRDIKVVTPTRKPPSSASIGAKRRLEDSGPDTALKSVRLTGDAVASIVPLQASQEQAVNG